MKPQSLRYRMDLIRYGIQRRRFHARAASHFAEIVRSIDQPAFVERFRKYWNPFPSAKADKFLDLSYWLKDNILLYHWLGLADAPPRLNVLDIGSGTGYFLLVCRQGGHNVLGLDIEGEEIYTDAFEFFKLNRIIHRIEPRRPLPDFPHRMDLINAYQTCFNQYEDRSPWGAEEWTFFLRDLRGRLNDRGRITIRFNLNHKTGEYYPDAVRRAVFAMPEFRARSFLDYFLLTAV